MLVTAGVFSVYIPDPDEAAHLARKLARRGHRVVLGPAWSAALRPIPGDASPRGSVKTAIENAEPAAQSPLRARQLLLSR